MAERLDQASFTRRLKFASTLMSVAVALLMMRLWYLQCVYGGYYRDLSEDNRVRTIRTVPPRGGIYDRNDQVLVRNRPAFHVALIMEDVPSVPETLTVLAQITGRDEALLLKQLQTPGKTRHFEPRIVMEDISRDELAKIKVNSYRLPGVIIKTVPARAYPNGALASQVLGYAREITWAQLESAQGKADYKTGDIVGQAGGEK